MPYYIGSFKKIDKIILICIIGSIPLALLLFFVFSMIYGPSIKQVITDRDLSENVNGVVDTLYNDDRNHNVRTAILKSKQIFLIPPEWESKVQIGDSLYKKKGSFLLEIYQRNGNKLILDYKSTIRTDLR